MFQFTPGHDSNSMVRNRCQTKKSISDKEYLGPPKNPNNPQDLHEHITTDNPVTPNKKHSKSRQKEQEPQPSTSSFKETKQLSKDPFDESKVSKVIYIIYATHYNNSYKLI